MDLPRPGYERHFTRIGAAELRLEVEASGLFDSNVYATSTNPIDDWIAVIQPRAELDWSSATTSLYGEAYADIRKHLDVELENATEFGAAIGGRYAPGRTHSLATEARFDRAVESRADPEARSPTNEPPRLIDIVSGQVAYAWSGSRWRLNITPEIQKFDYLDAAEADRDLTIYRASARVSWQPAAPVAIFAETYVNRRDFRTAVDFSGVDRDALTLGALIGVSREATARLRGRLGIGVFRSNPDDPLTKPFTGFAANGDLIWTPRTRTAITAQIFQGDVATVRAGASGRTDTRISLRIDQEARHNFLLNASVGWLKSKYRGTANRLETLGLEVGAEYLINRALSLVATAGITDRNADVELDEFSRKRVQIGLRVRY